MIECREGSAGRGEDNAERDGAKRPSRALLCLHKVARSQNQPLTQQTNREEVVWEGVVGVLSTERRAFSRAFCTHLFYMIRPSENLAVGAGE